MDIIDICCNWTHPSLEEKNIHWKNHFPPLKVFPLFVIWGIWKEHNSMIFEDTFQAPSLVFF